MKKDPFVSIIMPAYNASKTIKEAINSILAQTFVKFELIIVDDGSKDATATIIEQYRDPRIRYYRNERNMGLVNTLNRAISLCTGDYVARMDSDDISLPQRIEKQVIFMEAHMDCVICGTFAKAFIENNDGKKNTKRVLRYEVNDTDIKKELVFECCFAHPSVMFRRSVFLLTETRYHNDYLNSEDYKYWIDLMEFGEYHNIPEFLLLYRLSPSQMSAASDITLRNSSRCRMEYIRKVYGEKVYDTIRNTPLSILLIKKIKSFGIENKYLYKLLYLSFGEYHHSDLLYFIYSKDAFRLGIRTALQFLKRVIVKPAPVIVIS